ncbi:MAG: Acetolactate decarboxylase [Bacteroidota bacterium]|jgi:acetolactate decarboxylase
MIVRIKSLRHLALLSGWILYFTASHAQETENMNISVTGAMRETMWNGQLSGLIDLDSLKSQDHFFGLGPLEHLHGEIMLMGDTCYVSTVDPNGRAFVEKTYKAKAPFFVCARVDGWESIQLPTGVSDNKRLETFLDSTTRKQPRPFAFQMQGRVRSAQVHIMNLPPGTAVNEPADAHRHQADYFIEDEVVRILGFFSTKHQRVFTHHDTFLHLHLITADGRLMGHVDSLELVGEDVELKIGL